MLARTKEAITKKRRQLFCNAVYGAYVILADANLIRSASRMSTAEVVLITTGLAELNAAIGQSLGRSIQAVIEENRECTTVHARINT